MAFRRIGLSGATALAVLSTASWARAADYYVDPAGNDSNAGTSESAAWATLAPISKARSGDTVSLKAGGSWEATLRVSGYTVKSYGTGAAPLIKGSLSVSGSAVVDGLKIMQGTGSGTQGVMVSGSNNVVRNCEVDGTGGKFQLGFGIMGAGNLITHNSVHDLSGMSGDSGDMNTSGGAEAYMVMASDNEISYNSAVNCWGPNSTLGGAEGGCLEIVNGEGGSTISNVSFHHNYCEKSVGLFEACSGNFTGGDAIQENHGIIRDSYVAYNIAVDAMWLYLLQPVNTDFTNLVFEHNTIIHTPANADIPQQGADSFGLLVNTDAGYTFELKAGDIKVRNNLFVTTGGGSGMFSPPPSGDHYNNMFSPSAPMGGQLGTGESAAADPVLTSNWRLAKGSPAIDVGSTDALQQWTDIDGNAVPCGSAPDIGASEYCEGTGGTGGSGSGGTSSSSGGSASGGTSATIGGSAPAGGASSGGTSQSSGGSTSVGGTASVSLGGSTSTAGGSQTTGGTAANPAPTGGQTSTPASGGRTSGGSSSNPTTGGSSSVPTPTGGSSSVVSPSGGQSSSDTPGATGGSSASTGSSGGTRSGNATGGASSAGDTRTGGTSGAADSLPPLEQEGGCGCRVAGDAASGSMAGKVSLLALLAGAFMVRRRRSERTRSGRS